MTKKHSFRLTLINTQREREFCQAPILFWGQSTSALFDSFSHLTGQKISLRAGETTFLYY